jgi:integrase
MAKNGSVIDDAKEPILDVDLFLLTTGTTLVGMAPPSTFDEAWQIVWRFKFRFLSRSGYVERNIYCNHLENTIGKCRLSDISPLMLEELKVTRLKNGLAPQTVTHILALVKRIYNFLIRWSLYDGSNPVSKVSFPKADNQRHRFLTKDEATSLLAALKERDRQLWQMSLLSLSTGMRAGEIFHLCGEHVNLSQRTIRIVDPKNGKNRTVFLPDAALKMMYGCQLKPGRLVFPNSLGKAHREVSHRFLKVVDKLGLNDGLTDPRDRIVFHSLRHSFASWLVQNDQPLVVVAELLGHSSLQMAKRYAHLNQTRMNAASKVVDSFLI